MERLDAEAVVIGAGVVGLACAAALARSGKAVFVLDRESAFGTHTSSRNSEVIHAGIYYGEGTEKAALCAPGRRALYAYADKHNVPHKKVGKLIVATNDAEEERLSSILNRAKANGAGDVKILPRAAVLAREPDLSAVAAIWSPETGIIDSHTYMLTLIGEIEAAGGAFIPNAAITAATPASSGLVLAVAAEESFEVASPLIVNAAGLYAHRVASLTTSEGWPTPPPPLHLAKGSYAACRARSPFRSLIYPCPVDGGLGVHLTLDLGGRARFGPDVEWLDTDNPDTIDYAVNAERLPGFTGAIRRYWPGLPDDALVPDYAGVRPKLAGPGGQSDFLIAGPDQSGQPGVVHLFGIESPGLTASLAIADRVAGILLA